MENFINSIKAHLYERTANPLIGSFIFYWLICNYKLVIVLLDSELKANEKFDLIKTLYPQNIWTPYEGLDIHYSTLIGNGLLLPLIISILYIFAAPYPSKFIYRFWRNRQKELLEIKQKIDDETPLTNEQAKKIRQEYYSLELKYYDLLKSKQSNSVQEKTNSNNEELSRYEQSVLTIIAENSYGVPQADIQNILNLSQLECTHYLESLEDASLITSHKDDVDFVIYYTLTKQGRAYLVKHNLLD